jgi:hypothetical protein
MNQLKAAIIRGAVISIATAGATFFTTWAAADVKKAGIAAGAAFFTAILTRFGEGGYDAWRAANNIIHGADIQAQPPRTPAPAPAT